MQSELVIMNSSKYKRLLCSELIHLQMPIDFLILPVLLTIQKIKYLTGRVEGEGGGEKEEGPFLFFKPFYIFDGHELCSYQKLPEIVKIYGFLVELVHF